MPLYQCPNRTIRDDVLLAASFYQFVTNGSWPESGGILDQSATFVQAMLVFGSELNRLEKRAIDDASRPKAMKG